MKRLMFLAAVMIVAAPMPSAASFTASDLVYVPVVAHNDGQEGSVWRTDLYITNVDSTNVDVALFFMPSGGTSSNEIYLDPTEYGAAGREELGYKYTNEALADIPPGGTVRLEDVVSQFWLADLGGAARLGSLIVFAWESGTLDPVAPETRTFRNVVVYSRTYNDTTVWIRTVNEDEEEVFTEEPTQYGQTIPGVPWYNLADPQAYDEEAGVDFTGFILTGGEDTENTRFNLGCFNASDPLTTINLLVTPLDANGEPFLNPDTEEPIARNITIAPLGLRQYDGVLAGLFQLGDVGAVTFRITFNPDIAYSSGSSDPIPAFTCYGSVVDNRSNDPTTVLPSFEAPPFDIDCLWPWGHGDGGDEESNGASMQTLDPRPVSGRVAERPLRLPPSW